MKRFGITLATVALGATLLVGCGGSSEYTDGTFTGTSEGLKGEITVEVTIKDGAIETINIPENKETETIFASIEEYLIPEIIEANSADVDTLAGATTSSTGVIEAVQAALDQAQ